MTAAGCPNEPRCEHGAWLHDIQDHSDDRPRCCVEGCDCGSTLDVELDRLRAQVAAVRELHAIDEDKAQWGDKVCKGCATHMTHTYWPCATVKAIGVKA